MSSFWCRTNTNMTPSAACNKTLPANVSKTQTVKKMMSLIVYRVLQSVYLHRRWELQASQAHIGPLAGGWRRSPFRISATITAWKWESIKQSTLPPICPDVSTRMVLTGATGGSDAGRFEGSSWRQSSKIDWAPHTFGKRGHGLVNTVWTRAEAGWQAGT